VARQNIRDHSDAFDLPAANFKKLFRLNKETARELCNMVTLHLNRMQRNT
jgi:hypothetical protein